MSSGCSQPTFSGTVGARASQACCGVGVLDGLWPVTSAVLAMRRLS